MCYLLILLRHTILLFPFSVLCVVSLSLNDPHPLFIWHIPTHLFNFALMLLPLPTVQSLPLVVAQMVKNLPAMQETRVWSLGWEVPLEKGMATHSRIYVWRIPWMRSLVGYSHGVTKSQTWLSSNTLTFTFLHCKEFVSSVDSRYEYQSVSVQELSV